MPLPSRGVVAFILGKHGPKDAGMLVGDGDQGLVVALATIELDDPALQSTGACGLRIDGRLQCTASTLNQQGAQIEVAVQADPSQSGPAAGAMLPRREAEPGAKLTTILEDTNFFAINGCHDPRVVRTRVGSMKPEVKWGEGYGRGFVGYEAESTGWRLPR